MKLFYKYMTIFYNFSLTSSHLQPLQVENCDSNSRLVVDEDDNGKLRPDRVYQASAKNYFIEVSDIPVDLKHAWNCI